MHNRKFQNELGKFRGENSVEKNPHKAFVERLKKQVLLDESSTEATDGTSVTDDDVCSKEIMKKLEAKFDELFVDLDDDD